MGKRAGAGEKEGLSVEARGGRSHMRENWGEKRDERREMQARGVPLLR